MQICMQLCLLLLIAWHKNIHFSIREPTVGHNEIKLRAENFPFLVESTTVGTALDWDVLQGLPSRNSTEFGYNQPKTWFPHLLDKYIIICQTEHTGFLMCRSSIHKVKERFLLMQGWRIKKKKNFQTEPPLYPVLSQPQLWWKGVQLGDIKAFIEKFEPTWKLSTDGAVVQKNVPPPSTSIFSALSPDSWAPG